MNNYKDQWNELRSFIYDNNKPRCLVDLEIKGNAIYMMHVVMTDASPSIEGKKQKKGSHVFIHMRGTNPVKTWRVISVTQWNKKGKHKGWGVLSAPSNRRLDVDDNVSSVILLRGLFSKIASAYDTRTFQAVFSFCILPRTCFIFSIECEGNIPNRTQVSIIVLAPSQTRHIWLLSAHSRDTDRAGAVFFYGVPRGPFDLNKNTGGLPYKKM